MTDFDEKTKELQKRQAGYQDAAEEDKISNNKNTFNKWLDKNSTASQAMIDAKKASLGIT